MYLFLLLFICLHIMVICHENTNPLLNKENNNHVHREPSDRHMPKIMKDEGSHAHEHIKEHLDPHISGEQLSTEELQFHFFKSHDIDNNDLLDGTELFKAIVHRFDENKGKNASEYDIAVIVDDVLLDDLNNDGYLSYAEFLKVGLTKDT